MKKTAMMGLAFLMVMLILTCTAAHADTKNSTASITFSQGELEFLDPSISGLHNMDIGYGVNTIPLGPVNYRATDGEHTLRVSDPRENAGNWKVTVSLSEFSSTEADSDSTFVGDITLSNPSKYITGDTDPTDCSVPDSLTILGGESAVEVMNANSGIAKGWFDATWQGEDIMLSIDEGNALSISDEALYTATITWTLVNGI